MATNDHEPQQGPTPPHVLFLYAAGITGFLAGVMTFVEYKRGVELDYGGPILGIALLCLIYAGILKSFGLLIQAVRRRRAQRATDKVEGGR